MICEIAFFDMVFICRHGILNAIKLDTPLNCGRRWFISWHTSLIKALSLWAFVGTAVGLLLLMLPLFGGNSLHGDHRRTGGPRACWFLLCCSEDGQKGPLGFSGSVSYDTHCDWFSFICCFHLFLFVHMFTVRRYVQILKLAFSCRWLLSGPLQCICRHFIM